MNFNDETEQAYKNGYEKGFLARISNAAADERRINNKTE